MALRVLLQPGRLCAWRRVEQTTSTDVRCLLQFRMARHVTSEPFQNEWNPDLDMEADEIGHTPQEEPHPHRLAPPTSKHVRHKVTTRGNRLLFNVGRKLMTAEQFVRRVGVAKQRSPLAVDVDTTDFNVLSDSGVCGEGVTCDIGEGEEVGEREGVERGRSEEGSEGEREEREGEEGGEGEREGGSRSEGEREALTSGGSKRRDLFSMKETKRFLRGRGQVGGRLSLPPPEMTELLQCLRDKLSPGAKQWDVFTTVPSVLGSSRREVEERIDALRKMGFTRREVETVLLALPTILDVDYENVYTVCRILKSCIPGGYVLRGLLMRHPFLFLQPAKQVEERVKKLQELCQNPNALGFLLHNYPILLMASLTPSTLHTITKYTSSPHHTGTEGECQGMGHSWVAKALYHNLSTLPARMEPGPDVSALIDLLAEFQLDPTLTFIKFPGFFKPMYSHVASLLNVLTGSPLYLDTVAMRRVLCSVPDQLVWTEDVDCLQGHLVMLRSLFPSAKECSERVLTYPGLVLPHIKLEVWLENLSGVGFTRDQIVQLVSSYPNVLLQNLEEEFMPRMKLLLSVTNSSPSSLLNCPIINLKRILSTAVNVLNERLRYATKHKPDMISGQYLTEIFASEDKEFAKFCGRTTEQVHSETGLGGVELKGFKSRQRPTKSRVEMRCGRLRRSESSYGKAVCPRPKASPLYSRKLPILEPADRHTSAEILAAPPTNDNQLKVATSAVKSVKKSSRKSPAKKERKKSVPRTQSGRDSGDRSSSEIAIVSAKGASTDVKTKTMMNDNGAMKEHKARESAVEDVLTSPRQSPYGSETVDKQKTSNTVLTSTPAASHGKMNYARKNHRRMQTQQTC